jgi:Ca-activated chloride channel family protein
VFLSVLGFGTGNLQDSKMEALADKGNGNYAYVDSLREGRKVLVEQAAGTLLTIAKDVKLQIEFNPVRVAEYRLIGYENRVLATEDFANDRKDAGDLGAGHTVTALYEIVPTTVTAATASEPLRYQQGGAPTAAAHTGELMTVKLRFKQPEGDTSVLRELPVQDSAGSFDAASPDFQFAASVAAAGMLLRNSPHKGSANWDLALELAQGGLSYDPGGHRAEFVELLRKAKELTR